MLKNIENMIFLSLEKKINNINIKNKSRAYAKKEIINLFKVMALISFFLFIPLYIAIIVKVASYFFYGDFNFGKLQPGIPLYSIPLDRTLMTLSCCLLGIVLCFYLYGFACYFSCQKTFEKIKKMVSFKIRDKELEESNLFKFILGKEKLSNEELDYLLKEIKKAGLSEDELDFWIFSKNIDARNICFIISVIDNLKFLKRKV